MTLNEYIAVLKGIADAEDGHRGNSEVVQRDFFGPSQALRVNLRMPSIEMIKVATKREQYRKLATHNEDVTGVKVVLI